MHSEVLPQHQQQQQSGNVWEEKEEEDKPLPPIKPLHICDHKFSWEEVHDVIQKREFARLGRLEDDFAVYSKFMDEVKKKYVTVGDYILHSKFGYPCVPTPINESDPSETKLAAVVPEHIDNDLIIWTKNDFPYALEEPIEHYLIWSHNTLPKEKILSLIDHNLPNKEFVYWINPPILRSVANVFHVHILARPKPTAQKDA
jgi:hypothetical protein